MGPYWLITTDNDGDTLGEGVAVDHPTIDSAAQAAIELADSPLFWAILYDDGDEVRELNRDEDRRLRKLAAVHGVKLGRV